MTILVCGGRDYNNTIAFLFAMDRIFDEFLGKFRVIHGDASGADSLAAQWCEGSGIPHTTYVADWTTHGKAAGPIRNQRMLDEGRPDLVIAFPGGRGTYDMVQRALAAGVPVREV